MTTASGHFSTASAVAHSDRMRARAVVGLAVAAVVGAIPIEGVVQGRLAPSGSGCPDIGDTRAVDNGFPERLSSLVGADIRTGGHECFERVVLELQGAGELPGYRVRYEADPILKSPSDLPTDVAGDATLVLSFGAWMTNPDGSGYGGPTEFVPTNVVNIKELELIENFEGQSAWAIGLDRQRGFAVSTLTDPVRIVIDIELDAAGTPTPTSQPAGPAPSLPPTR